MGWRGRGESREASGEATTRMQAGEEESGPSDPGVEVRCHGTWVYLQMELTVPDLVGD